VIVQKRWGIWKFKMEENHQKIRTPNPSCCSLLCDLTDRKQYHNGANPQNSWSAGGDPPENSSGKEISIADSTSTSYLAAKAEMHSGWTCVDAEAKNTFSCYIVSKFSPHFDINILIIVKKNWTSRLTISYHTKYRTKFQTRCYFQFQTFLFKY